VIAARSVTHCGGDDRNQFHAPIGAACRVRGAPASPFPHTVARFPRIDTAPKTRRPADLEVSGPSHID